jgi:sarcosine oxidase subunit alpha
MLLIPCPWCGPRDESEFHYGGQAHIAYPEDPAALTDDEWARYLFFRDNPKGPFAERWMHSAGCRQWFNAVRDTSTNVFVNSARPAFEDTPAGRSGVQGAKPLGGVRGEAPVSGRGGVGESPSPQPPTHQKAETSPCPRPSSPT